jgi:hypothetical protein
MIAAISPPFSARVGGEVPLHRKGGEGIEHRQPAEVAQTRPCNMFDFIGKEFQINVSLEMKSTTQYDLYEY